MAIPSGGRLVPAVVEHTLWQLHRAITSECVANSLAVEYAVSFLFDSPAVWCDLSFLVTLFVRGVTQSEVTTLPKLESHRGLDMDLSLDAEVDIRKGWKRNNETR